MPTSQLCALPKTDLRSVSLKGHYLFFLVLLICSVIASAAGVHGNMELIILQVSAPWQRRRMLSKKFLCFHYVHVCQGGSLYRTLSHSRCSKISTNPSAVKTSAEKWLDMRLHPEFQSDESSPPLSSWGLSVPVVREEVRFQFRGDSWWSGSKEQCWSSVKHEQHSSF